MFQTGENFVLLLGNLTTDPKVFFTQDRVCICRFCVAINGRIKNKDGLWDDTVEFINCVAYGRTAENIGAWCGKGRQVRIKGQIKSSKYTDKNNITHYGMNVKVDTCNFDNQTNKIPKNIKQLELRPEDFIDTEVQV